MPRCLQQLRTVERSISSQDGQQFLARVLPYRTSQDKIGGAVLTFVDVTKLRAAEDMVTVAEERVRDAIAASKDFAVITTDASGAISAWNEGATAIFGHEASAVLGAPIDLIFTPDDRAAGVPDDERRRAARDGRASDERWHLRPRQHLLLQWGGDAAARRGRVASSRSACQSEESAASCSKGRI